MTTITPHADLLPSHPTVRDFRRLAANVTLARYSVDPACRWDPEEVAERLWENRDGFPFPGLAIAAVRAAVSYTGIRTPSGIGHYIAGMVRE